MSSSFAAPGWHTSPGWLGRVEAGEAAGPGTTRIKDVAAAGMTECVPGGDKTRQVRPARGAAGGMLWFAPAARAEGVPIGGLGPGGFADAYHLRPLWNRGDLGQGQTIVFF